MSRISMAFRAFFGILGGRLPADIARAHGYEKAAKRPEPPREQPRAETGALQLLGLMQREARLIDFFLEDISPYSDEQVGAGVRSIHAQCQELLRKHFQLAPVIDGVEGTFVRTESAGALAREPGAIRFTGNLPAQGRPSGGVLRHRGWRADSVTLPSVSPKQNLSILAPAELEVE
ncbi:MAG: DUF2760 domain-containing protein [Bryobacteraceae bacterium]